MKVQAIAQVKSEEFARLLAARFNGHVDTKTVNGEKLFIVLVCRG